MDRDELVERVCGVIRPIYGCDDDAAFIRCEINDPHSCSCRISARAALAIIEPAVREECARVALSYPNAPDAGPHEAHGRDMAAVGIAAAIRAGAKP